MHPSKNTIQKLIYTLRNKIKPFTPPLVESIIKEYSKDPYLILISCLLSLRAKDIVTIHVCRNLFQFATTPQELLKIPLKKLETIIFKIGLYQNKAKVLHNVTKIIHEDYSDIVPNSREKLLAIKGIGRKTANLVLGLAFDQPAICVDIHVHRISNRLGLVETKNPDKTEKALEKIIPKENWIEWNKLLVMWGQNICTPRNPRCTQCALKPYCHYGKTI